MRLYDYKNSGYWGGTPPSPKRYKEQRVENLEDLKLRKKYASLLSMFITNLDTLFKANVAQLTNLYGKENVIVSEDQHFIFAKGKSPEICLVAHLDTVAEQHVPIPVINDGVVYSNHNKGCLGADDRAGAYAILRLLENGHRPSVLLTTGEESGCIGVRNFNEVHADSNLFENTRLFIEMDRKGDKDCIDYSGRNPKEVTDYFKQFGFEGGRGSLSDVKHLTIQFGIPHANLSVGYYDQHSHRETLNLAEMENTIFQVENMLKNPIDKRYDLEPEKVYTPPKHSGIGGYWGGVDSYDDLDQYILDDLGNLKKLEENFPIDDNPEYLEELPEGWDEKIALDDYFKFEESTLFCSRIEIDTVFLDENGFPYKLEIYSDKNGSTIDEGFRLYTFDTEGTETEIKVFDEMVGNLYEEYLIEKECEKQEKEMLLLRQQQQQGEEPNPF